jgi:2-methylcitrate dehydratase PrpD
MMETQKLADWSCQLKWSDIPPHTRAKTKQCLLEYLSCCLAARQEKPARLLINTLRQLGSTPQASIIGHAQKLSVDQAALVNGALGHIWEIDDTHRHTMSHPGESIIPAALAIGEWLGNIDGKSVLTAIVIGYEVAIRICHALSPSHLERGWHPTGTTNTFGAAAAAGKLLGLSNQQMAWALGLAATQAAGTFCHVPERAMSKDLNPGKAAANGILAAMLAREGFTGSPTAIENEKGFARTHADAFVPERMTAGLGESFKIDEIAFKPYSCCRHCHAAIEALLRLRKAYDLTPEMVGAIRVSLYPMAAWFVNDPAPFNKGTYGVKYSVQFNLALALVAGDAGLQKALFDVEYMQTMLNDASVQEVMEKVEVEIDADLAREWPNKWPARVTVLLADGGTRQQLIEYPLGEPEHPLPYAQLVDKFKRASRGYLTESEASLVPDLIENLEQPESVNTLLQLVSGEKSPGGTP